MNFTPAFGGGGGNVGRVTVTNGSEFSRAPGCEKKMRGEVAETYTQKSLYGTAVQASLIKG